MYVNIMYTSCLAQTCSRRGYHGVSAAGSWTLRNDSALYLSIRDPCILAGWQFKNLEDSRPSRRDGSWDGTSEKASSAYLLDLRPAHLHSIRCGAWRMIWHGLSWLQHRSCSAFRSIRIVGATCEIAASHIQYPWERNALPCLCTCHSRIRSTRDANHNHTWKWVPWNKRKTIFTSTKMIWQRREHIARRTDGRTGRMAF